MSRRLYRRFGLPVRGEISTSGAVVSGSSRRVSTTTSRATLHAIKRLPAASLTLRRLRVKTYSMSIHALAIDRKRGDRSRPAFKLLRLYRRAACVPVDVRPHHCGVATLLEVDKALDQKADAVGLPEADQRVRAGRGRAVHRRCIVHHQRRLIAHRDLDTALVAEEDLVALDQHHNSAFRLVGHV